MLHVIRSPSENTSLTKFTEKFSLEQLVSCTVLMTLSVSKQEVGFSVFPQFDWHGLVVGVV